MSKLTKLLKRLFHIHDYYLDYSLSIWSSYYNPGHYYYVCKCGKNFTSRFEEPESPWVAQWLEKEYGGEPR